MLWSVRPGAGVCSMDKPHHRELKRSNLPSFVGFWPGAASLLSKAEGSCRSPLVWIHVADERFWLVLGYCSFFPGHLYGWVNTAAQYLTTSHPTTPAWPAVWAHQWISYAAHALPCRCCFMVRRQVKVRRVKGFVSRSPPPRVILHF